MLLRELGQAGGVASDPGLPKAPPAPPCFPQTPPPREDWEQGTTADPCVLVFQYRCRGGFFQLAACSARGGYRQPPEARGEREESSLLGRNAGRAPPPSRSPSLRHRCRRWGGSDFHGARVPAVTLSSPLKAGASFVFLLSPGTTLLAWILEEDQTLLEGKSGW